MHRNRHQALYIFLIAFLLFYLLYKLFSAFSASLFFNRPSRLNVVIYGPSTVYYSFDSQDKQNYRIQFDPEVKVDVPGGYGKYRVGSLGKLVKLEHNPEIFKKTFSITTTTFVHYYFYQNADEIYYEDVSEEKTKPSITQLLFFPSNASILDRIYLTVFLINNQDDNYKLIRYRKEKNEALQDVVFQDESFIRDSIGLLYNSQYRKEQQSIQVLYRQNYKTAESVSALFEGNGIRVSDIAKNTSINDCRVMVSDDLSQTAKDLSKFFSCPIVKGETDVYDIIFVMGSKEEDWRVN